MTGVQTCALPIRVTYESLTLGCRTITKDDGICNKEFFGEPPPFMHAGSAAEIAERFRQLIADPNDVAGIGAASRQWAERYHSSARLVALQEAQFARLAPAHGYASIDDVDEPAVVLVAPVLAAWRRVFAKGLSRVQSYAPGTRWNARNSALETVGTRSIK